MYVPALPEKYGQKNSWIWGAGFEWATFTLTTQFDGNRTIKISHPLIDGGYQWNWPKYYFNIKWQFKWPNENPNLTYYDGFSMGIGYVW